MNSDFQTPVDICNRALTHCGARRIDTLDDANDRASECQAVYDKMRVAELRRNFWIFAIRKNIVRPLDSTCVLVTFPTFSATATYPRFFPVTAASGRVFQCNAAMAAGGGPDDDTAGSSWVRYFGADVAFAYDSDTSYWAGEIVYAPATKLFYRALANGTTTDPSSAPPAWSATTTYKQGDTVTYLAAVYQSDASLNLNNAPNVTGWTLLSSLVSQVGNRVGVEWLKLTGVTFEALELPYPIESGPGIAPSGRSIFRKPVGCIREAPQAPKAGYVSPLGSPANLSPDDWEHDGNYIVTTENAPFPFRFVADVSDVSRFDPMFCELLGARIGMEICERVTQSSDKLSNIASKYKLFGTEARTINGIEAGPTEPPLDDYVACRA